MRKAINACVLALALAVSVHAGEVLTPPAPQPPTAVEQPSIDVSEAILTLLANVLPLF